MCVEVILFQSVIISNTFNLLLSADQVRRAFILSQTHLYPLNEIF